MNGKKFASLMLVMIMAVFMLAGCGGAGKDAGGAEEGRGDDGAGTEVSQEYEGAGGAEDGSGAKGDSGSVAAKDDKIDGYDRWRVRYVEYINNIERIKDDYTGNYTESYKLIDINGDDIPELYINQTFSYRGDIICGYSKGTIIDKNISSGGLTYIEGKNLFMDSGGKMDSYYNKVYSMKKGGFDKLGEGTFGAYTGGNSSYVQTDASGRPVYHYVWDNEELDSKIEYEKKLKKVFDKKLAVSPMDGANFDPEQSRYVGNGMCSYDEIVDAIYAY